MIFKRRKDEQTHTIKINKENNLNEDPTSETVELTVEEAYSRDVGRSIARIDPRMMEELGLQSGDIIEIIGKESVPAIVWPGYPEDKGKGIIRIDGSLRSNAEVSIGDKVRIKKVRTRMAEKLVIAPTEPVRFMGGEAYLLRLLEGRPVKRGQKIKVELFGHILTFVIISTVPDGVVVVRRNTKIDLKDKPIKSIEEEIRENPKRILEEWIGKKVAVFTIGEPIVGILKGYDSEMNIILENAYFINDPNKKQFKTMLLNSKNIVSLTLDVD